MDKKDPDKLKRFILEGIAGMICGDDPCFPYRSSSYLTKFFKNDLGLPYCHDGTTRKWWVLSVLEELNQESFKSNDIISDNVLHVLQKLFDIKYFMPCDSKNYLTLSEEDPTQKVSEQHNDAIKAANSILEYSGIEIIRNKNNDEVQIKSLNRTIISTNPKALIASNKFEFSPIVFNITDINVDSSLVSVMMPFGREFDSVYKAIGDACIKCNLSCKRADDIWDESVIVDDIASLICRSQIVIVDFSGKNPNVMYETGIAHTLGKIVIPISQSINDVPFDLKHHRTLEYLFNDQGLFQLKNELINKLSNTQKVIGNTKV